MYYNDEVVEVKFEIDNSSNTRAIKMIECSLFFEIKIKKNSTEILDSYSVDLDM